MSHEPEVIAEGMYRLQALDVEKTSLGPAQIMDVPEARLVVLLGERQFSARDLRAIQEHWAELGCQALVLALPPGAAFCRLERVEAETE